MPAKAARGGSVGGRGRLCPKPSVPPPWDSFFGSETGLFQNPLSPPRGPCGRKPCGVTEIVSGALPFFATARQRPRLPPESAPPLFRGPRDAERLRARCL